MDGPEASVSAVPGGPRLADEPEDQLMRYYIVSGTEMRICAKRPAKAAKGELVVTTLEDLRKSNWSAKHLLAVLSALPGAKRRVKDKSRAGVIDRLWAGLEALPDASEGRRTGSTRKYSKQAQVIEMFRRPEGATIEMLADLTGWQHHTIRGLIAGALKRKLNLLVVSEKSDGGERRYRIADSH
jgi:hypothetical protein